MKDLQTAVFGGGCFWCTEAAFKLVPGVKSVTPGYAGGKTENPTYQEVVGGETGHAEVVEVVFDPAIVSYEGLLKVFFTIHDPTTLNKQGGDIGTQYRSLILYNSNEQQKEAEEYIDNLENIHAYPDPVVTQVKQLKVFYPAEEYHKDYFEKHPGEGYCQLVIAPKIKKLEKEIL